MRSIFTATFTGTLLLGLLGGCGGGSSGTGTGVETRTIEGSVIESDGDAAAGVQVTVVQTGAVTVTDAAGDFSLETPVTAGDVDLRLEGENIDATVKVPDVSEEPSTVNVDITIPEDGQGLPTAIINLEVLAKVVGRCDIYFENRRIIRQSNAAPQGIECIARVSVKGDGKTLGNVGVKIQSRRCAKASEWVDVAEGKTMSGTNSGIAQVPFPFFNDREHCVYRIIAPEGVETITPIVYEIHTFTKQAFDDR